MCVCKCKWKWKCANTNVNGNRRAARNGRNEKRENEKLIIVTAGPFWGINFELQLQSCLRRRINIGVQLPSGPLQEFKNVIIIAEISVATFVN